MENISSTLTCRKCGVTKHKEDFVRDNSNYRGHRLYCKCCKNSGINKWQGKNIICQVCKKSFTTSANNTKYCIGCRIVAYRYNKEPTISNINNEIPQNTKKKHPYVGEHCDRSIKKVYEAYMAANPVYAHFVNPKKYPRGWQDGLGRG